MTIGNGINGRAPITRDFPDTRVNALLFEYLDKRVFITPELDNLVQHKFVSRKDRRFQKTVRLTWIGIIIAVVIVVASIIIAISGSSKPLQLDPIDKAYVKSLSDQISNTINNEQINKEASNLQKILDYFKRPIKVEVQTEYDARHAQELGNFRIERIARVATRFLTCGDYRQGLARIRCSNPECRQEYFRLFSCRGFYLCPSCSQKRSSSSPCPRP